MTIIVPGHTVKMTIAQGNEAGKSIMTDARCTAEVKAAIMRGLSKPFEGYYTYTATGAVPGKQNQWFDEVMLNAAA
jgi:hypothetical protein